MARQSKGILVTLRSFALLALAAGCAGPSRIIKNQSSDAEFGAYRTYGFAAALTEEGRDDSTSMEALKSASSREMEARGYVQAEDPDLTLNFLVYSWEERESKPTSVPIYTYRPLDEFTGYSGYETKAGHRSKVALLLQVIDSRGEQVVWEAARISRVTSADEEDTSRSEHAAIEELFGSYPFVAGSDAAASGVVGTTVLDECEPLAKGGDASAQFLVGAMYYGGYGTPQDFERAVEWYRRSADQEYGPAMLNLGLTYLTGQGVARDDTQARRWLLRAAELELPVAQYSLGSVYLSGRGGAQDDAEAARWIRRAAELGLAAAQTDLALMYLQGRGVPQDDAQALRWYTLAAEQGFARAQLRLGMMYEHGRGVSHDPTSAYAWYALAAESGDSTAAEHRDLLGRAMPADRRAQAERRARAWVVGRR
jgi:TPR repeat protein